MAVNFRELLSVKTEDIKNPVALSEGTYHGILAAREFGESSRNKTPYVRYTVRLHSAGDDVDPADIAEIDLSSKKLRVDFYLTPDSLYRLRDFLQSLGLSTEGRSLEELIEESLNASVKVYVTQRINPEKPNDAPYNDIKTIVGDN